MLMENIVFTEQDKVWQVVWCRTQDVLLNPHNRLHPSFAKGLKELNLSPDKFPTMEYINQSLAKIGWKAEWVSGFIPPRVFSEYISARCFPVASNIRSLIDVEHSPVPDAVHDILGHLPMLFDAEFRQFMEDIGKAIIATPVDKNEEAMYLAQKKLGVLESQAASSVEIEKAKSELELLKIEVKENPGLSTRLSRLFLWTIEFGLVCGRGGPQILGAAIMSSPKEMAGVFSGGVKLTPFSSSVTDFDINFTEPQDQLFVAGSISHYNDVLKKTTANRYPIIAHSLTTYEEFKESPEDFTHFKEGIDWIESFIAQPNEKLQRSGHVCPFVRPAMDHQLFHMVAMESGEGSTSDAIRIGKYLINLFYDLYTDEESQSRGALVAFFPNVDREKASDFIDAGHRSLRMEFVKNGLMIGEFHKHSNVTSVRNAEFHVMKSPVPMFAVRALSHHDVKFLDRPEFSIEERRQFFEYYLKYLTPELGQETIVKVNKMIASLEG